MSSGLTCLTCHLQFYDTSSQKAHFVSDWHKRNLLLKLKGKDPITLSEFEEEKEEELKKQKEVIASQDQNEENAETVEEMNERIEKEALEYKYYPLRCFFCQKDNSSLRKNLSHMVHAHSFQMDDVHYIVDMQGLLEYLAEKINLGHMCIACNRSFSSAKAARSHMKEKQHCYYEYDVDELADFYDYSTTYPKGYSQDDEEEELEEEEEEDDDEEEEEEDDEEEEEEEEEGNEECGKDEKKEKRENENEDKKKDNKKKDKKDKKDKKKKKKKKLEYPSLKRLSTTKKLLSMLGEEAIGVDGIYSEMAKKKEERMKRKMLREQGERGEGGEGGGEEEKTDGESKEKLQIVALKKREGGGEEGKEEEEEVHPVDINPLNELILSNGKQLGTRQLARYYKQRIPYRSSKRELYESALVQMYEKKAWTGKLSPEAKEGEARERRWREVKESHSQSASIAKNKIQRKYMRIQLSWK
ncbi:putative C2H2 type zinc-finger protein [Monocercomonoides exilis]|uniref:putative C2H2 type zinc-finger protein n=1 Tax=Monocercomonoides exilis TaxID=2049356 RepID=UPI00355A4EC0|nr:putative C2H2 type zinc-finger protein [Monocercomonoides exilis]|eukprot:MONOS_4407.1-p1 / transcript=MONOS_4407.1 / gene=MONOS_4407 / organism=Monocercomonoides_exilis_PA203 / gene_product=C2H2 type zinc-finger protein / transcript_product=C2H2 type zinc-finger protein / location=Mono_scaffold00117:29646-32456(+) / protein_length=470 / sequence_SO=supercontig / SO=protein_coding / is_pseudo=false